MFILFVIFVDPLQLILTPPFINFSNFIQSDYKEVHRSYISLFMDGCCLVTVSGSLIY